MVYCNLVSQHYRTLLYFQWVLFTWTHTHTQAHYHVLVDNTSKMWNLTMTLWDVCFYLIFASRSSNWVCLYSSGYTSIRLMQNGSAFIVRVLLYASLPSKVHLARNKVFLMAAPWLWILLLHETWLVLTLSTFLWTVKIFLFCIAFLQIFSAGYLFAVASLPCVLLIDYVYAADILLNFFIVNSDL